MVLNDARHAAKQSTIQVTTKPSCILGKCLLRWLEEGIHRRGEVVPALARKMETETNTRSVSAPIEMCTAVEKHLGLVNIYFDPIGSCQ